MGFYKLLSVMSALWITGVYPSCESTNSNLHEDIVSLVLSPDDASILFSYKGCIFTADVDGSNPRLVAKPEKELYFSHPKFSSDGKHVLFISFDDKQSSAVFITEFKGNRKIEQITDYSGLITEAIFSENDEKIYIVVAREFRNYSIMAAPAPHKMDIFSIDIRSREMKQITKLNAYQISGLVAWRERLLFVKNLDGIYFADSDEPGDVFWFKPAEIGSSPRQYCAGIVFKKDSLFLLSSGAYMLFDKKIDDDESRLILHTHYQMYNLNVFRKSPRILYTHRKSGKTFLIYDLTNHRSDTVQIAIND